MKQLLFLPLLAAVISINGQSITGLWTGTLTRDYGNEIKTDSIEFRLEQQGEKITGYSILFISPGVYIKAKLEGNYQPINKTLRLTETAIDHTNQPDRGDEFFLDRYLLTYDENDMLVLTGKSISCDRKFTYTRSKMMLRKTS